MILELVQMLYTAHHKLNSCLPKNAYRPFSPQHPTAIWVRLCVENYNYTVQLAFYLSKEYTLRYNKIHCCEEHISWLIKNIPVFKTVANPYQFSKKKVKLATNKDFESLNLTPLPLAMPEDAMRDDPVSSYRSYYCLYKNKFATWKTAKPYWYNSLKIILFN